MIPGIVAGGASVAGGGGPTDPYWSSVVACLNAVGTAGSTSIVDATGRTWSAAGNAQISTALGYNSILLDGTGDYIHAAQDTGSAFGTGDLTVEAWIYLLSYPAAASIFESLPLSGIGARNNSHAFYTDAGGVLRLFTNGNNAISAGTVPLNTLVHAKWSRSSGVCKLGLAGTQVGSVADSVNDNLGGFVIGTLSDTPGAAGTCLNAHIVAARLTRGVDRYPGSTYTPDTFPFPTS